MEEKVKMQLMVTFLVIIIFFAFCDRQEIQGITEEEAKAVTYQILKIWNEGDTGIADGLYDSDYVRHHPVPSASASLEDFINTVKTNREVYPDYRLAFDEIITEGDRIIAFATVTGTNTGPLEGRPATGKTIRMNGIYVYRIKGGRIAEEWTYFNLLSYYQQLGYALAPPENQKFP
jgi:steroid delta-isomerase-like uncharacterized protein